jgi:hypothetical protein
MSSLILHTRSFHPLENFGAGGLGYEGDNRDFGTDTGKTSRIKSAVEINLEAAKIKTLFILSDPSRNAMSGWEQKYDDPRKQPTASVQGQVDPYRQDGDQHAQVFLSYRGQNFARGSSLIWT